MREICLSGFAELTRHYANDLPDHVEIWAMNEANLYLRRPAAYWFQLHPRVWNRSVSEENNWPIDGYGRPPQHLQWLKKLPIPVLQQEVDERIPMSTKYPLEEITKRYGREWVEGKRRPYLTSSAAYMLAYAIWQHDTYREQHPRGKKGLIKAIHLAGIELAIGTEYFDQRPCVEYWLGMAEGRGIRVVTALSGSSILTGPIYGIDHDSPLRPQMWRKAGVKAAAVTAPMVAIAEDEEGKPIGLERTPSLAESI